MSETLVAASSPAESTDVFNGEQPSLAEYSQYRQSGELPERFKPAEAVAETAPAEETTEGEEPETEPASEPEQQQEKKPKGKTAEDRIAQLEATIEKIKRGAGLERKTDVAPVTEQPKAQPQNYAEWRKDFKPSQWIEGYGKQNPEATYEDATAAMADYLGDVRDQFKGIEQERLSQEKEMNARIAEAKQRYGDVFDDVVRPAVETIVSDPKISPVIKTLLNESPVVADLIFTIGSDEATLAKFVALAKNKPGDAIRYIALVENGIVEELANTGKGEETPRDDKGKFTASPAKPKTSAPKPPSPVSGASTGAFDVSDESSSPEEWARKRTEQLAKRK